MSTERDLPRILHTWLHEDAHEYGDRVLDSVVDLLDSTPQRPASWLARRFQIMNNNFVRYGLAAAAVVVVAIIGFQLIGGSNQGGPAPTETPEPTATPAASTPVEVSLPVGLHVMDPPAANISGDDSVTVTIPALGWFAGPDEGSVFKDLGGDDRVTVVAVRADSYHVPRNTCNWRIDNPWGDGGNGTADTVDEFMAHLAEQTYDTEGSLTRDLSTPVDITIDGYPGQSITGVAPVYSDGDPADCDEQRFCSLLDRDGWGCYLSHLEPNALVTLWIVNPATHLRVVAASSWPTTSSELRAEMNAIVDSMIFTID